VIAERRKVSCPVIGFVCRAVYNNNNNNTYMNQVTLIFAVIVIISNNFHKIDKFF
jgi:hypothetical protein